MGEVTRVNLSVGGMAITRKGEEAGSRKTWGIDGMP